MSETKQIKLARRWHHCSHEVIQAHQIFPGHWYPSEPGDYFPVLAEYPVEVTLDDQGNQVGVVPYGEMPRTDPLGSVIALEDWQAEPIAGDFYLVDPALDPQAHYAWLVDGEPTRSTTAPPQGTDHIRCSPVILAGSDPVRTQFYRAFPQLAPPEPNLEGVTNPGVGDGNGTEDPLVDLS